MATDRIPQEDTSTVLSHESAAAYWRLPDTGSHRRAVGAVPPITYTVTTGRPSRRVAVRRYVAPLAAGNVEDVDGVPVTSLARTVLDLARTLPEDDAVALFDHVLANGTMTRSAIDGMLTTSPIRTGVPRARRALAAADGRCENLEETRSRLLITKLGFPAPDVGATFLTDDGPFRASFWWPAHRLVGQFDPSLAIDARTLADVTGSALGLRRGTLGEYDARPAEDISGVLHRRRCFLFERAGIGLVTWGPDDLLAPFALEVRLRAAGLPLRGQPSPAGTLWRGRGRDRWERPNGIIVAGDSAHPHELTDLRSDRHPDRQGSDACRQGSHAWHRQHDAPTD